LLIPTLERGHAAFFGELQSIQDHSHKFLPNSPSELVYDETTRAAQADALSKPGAAEQKLPVADTALRLSDLEHNFPSAAFTLRLSGGRKISRVRVRPVPSAELVDGQRVVLASPSLKLRGAKISAVVGIFSMSTRTDAVTEEPLVIISVKSDGGLAQAKMPAADWNTLKSVGLLEDSN